MYIFYYLICICLFYLLLNIYFIFIGKSDHLGHWFALVYTASSGAPLPKKHEQTEKQYGGALTAGNLANLATCAPHHEHKGHSSVAPCKFHLKLKPEDELIVREPLRNQQTSQTPKGGPVLKGLGTNWSKGHWGLAWHVWNNFWVMGTQERLSSCICKMLTDHCLPNPYATCVSKFRITWVLEENLRLDMPSSSVTVFGTVHPIHINILKAR